MDFSLLVRNVLFEDQAAGDVTNTTDQQEAQYKQGLSNYIKQKYQTLKTVWSKHYGTNNKFLNEPEIIPLVNNVTYGAGKTRSGGYDKDRIEQIFPLYDFVAYLYENYFKGKQNPSDNDLNQALTTFTQTIEKSSKIPLEFPAISSWGKSIKEDYIQLSKQEIGKIKFENLPPNLSFWGAIKNLLQTYEKVFALKTPKWLDSVRGITSIQKIFSDPNIAAKGAFVFSDENLNLVYDSLSKQTITNLAIAAYRLYKHQLTSTITDEKEVNKLLLNSDKFKQFMGTNNDIAAEMSWLNVSPQQAPPEYNAAMQMQSFDQTFELLTKQLLGEANLDTPDPHPEKMRNDQAKLKADLLARKAARDVAKQANQPVPNQFAGKKEGSCLYNIENLKKPTQIAEVTSFIKAFQDLANKLKNKSSVDIMGGLTQIAKGLSSLGKTMGT